MATARNDEDDDDQENEEQEKQEEKEEQLELIKGLKAPKPLFFAFIPKGSGGELVVHKSKSERNKLAIEKRREIGGGAPVLGTCSGPWTDKVFVLDKEPSNAEKLQATLKKVIKSSAKLNMIPDIQQANQEPDEEEA